MGEAVCKSASGDFPVQFGEHGIRHSRFGPVVNRDSAMGILSDRAVGEACPGFQSSLVWTLCGILVCPVIWSVRGDAVSAWKS